MSASTASTKTKDNTMLLVELQKLDIELVKANKKLQEMPATLKAAEQKWNQAKTELAAVKETHKKVQLEIRQREGDVAQLKTAVADHKEKLRLIKNNADYGLATSSIKKQEQRISEIDDEVLTRMSDLENINAKAKVKEEEIKTLEAAYQDAKKMVEKEQSVFRKTLEEQQATRDALAKKVEPEFIGRYNRVRPKYPLNGIVEVKKQVCQGCFMAVTIEVFSELCLGRELKSCPVCGRLIYLGEEIKPLKITIDRGEEVAQTAKKAKKPKKKKVVEEEPVEAIEEPDAIEEPEEEEEEIEEQEDDEVDPGVLVDDDEEKGKVPGAKSDVPLDDDLDVPEKAVLGEDPETKALNQALGVETDEIVDPEEDEK